MLTSLHVKNLAVIEDEEITFGNGLNILTGETGAGKSVLLGSIGLALGGKADKNMIRSNTDYAIAELNFCLDPDIDFDILKELQKEDIYPDDNNITFTRKITRDRSTSRINGETVSTAVVSRISSLLLDIHGQHDNTLLLKSANHLELLDLYGGEKLKSIKNEFKKAYSDYRNCQKKLDEASLDELQREHNLALINHEIDEIENSNLKPGEDEELDKQFEFLKNAQKISEGAGTSSEFLNGSDGASEMLSRAIRELSSISRYDEELVSIESALSEAEDILNEASRNISRYVDRFEYDSESFALVSDRIDLINRLKNKYGSTIEEILHYRDFKIQEADKLNNYEAYVSGLRSDLASSRNRLDKISNSLTQIRKTSSLNMEQKIMENLKDLNFAKVEFEIRFTDLEDICDHGAEDVEFYISLNPGEKPGPLSRVASGGELSRIMLAIKTAMSDKDNIPTLIFDEIDAGISGITANKVGDKLQIIAGDRQVICITHLAQIASRADKHFLIRKDFDEANTSTHIISLNEEDSIEELARIISGDSLSDSALKAARELRNAGRRTM